MKKVINLAGLFLVLALLQACSTANTMIRHSSTEKTRSEKIAAEMALVGACNKNKYKNTESKEAQFTNEGSTFSNKECVEIIKEYFDTEKVRAESTAAAAAAIAQQLNQRNYGCNSGCGGYQSYSPGPVTWRPFSRGPKFCRGC